MEKKVQVYLVKIKHYLRSWKWSNLFQFSCNYRAGIPPEKGCRVQSSKLAHVPLQWRHNGHDSVSNHQPHDCLLNRIYISRCRSKKTSKLRVTDLCAGNSPVTSEFPIQKASNAENVGISIWWRHHVHWRWTDCNRCQASVPLKIIRSNAEFEILTSL